MSEENESKKSGYTINPTLQAWFVGIFGGLISSAIFLLFLQPLILSLSSATIHKFSDINLILLNAAYEQAVLGPLNGLLYMSCSIVITFGLALSVTPVGILFIFSKRRQDRNINSTSVARLLVRIRSIIKRFRILRYFLVALFIFQIIWIAISTNIFVKISFGAMQARATYERQFAIIEPVLSEDQEEGISSRWYSIKSKAEYEQLMDELESVARSKRLATPKRLI